MSSGSQPRARRVSRDTGLINHVSIYDLTIEPGPPSSAGLRGRAAHSRAKGAAEML